MSYFWRAYAFTLMSITVFVWYLTRIWNPNDIPLSDLCMHALVFCVFAWEAYDAWRSIVRELKASRNCKCGHLRSRHNNDKHCLQEVQSSGALLAFNEVAWRACACQEFHYDWSVVK